MERMARYLIKTLFVDDFAFTCNGWKNLFSISEPVFQEMCVEFFASVSLEEDIVDPSYLRALVFHLGDEWMECSLTEFAWRMGIYQEHETRSLAFKLFLRSTIRDYLSGVSGYDFCGTVANRVFYSSVS